MTLERFDIAAYTDRLQAFLHRQRYDFVLSQLGDSERVLEIGTGVGAFTQELASHCENLVGVEFDLASCEETRRRTQGKATILQADARNLPLGSEQFSFVICLEVLEHLGDWRAGVKNIHRCLRKNGTALISVPYRRYGGPSKTNEHHPYEPGEMELVGMLDQLFERVEVRYQCFAESPFMTLARLLHIRRFVGLAKLYRDLAMGETSALDRVALTQQPRGMKIGLVIVVAGKKSPS